MRSSTPKKEYYERRKRDRRRTATFFFHLGFGFSGFDTLNKKVETFRHTKKNALEFFVSYKKKESSRPLSFALCWCLVFGHATDFYGGDHPNNDASFSDDDSDDFWWGECATGKTRSGACVCGGAKNKCAKRQKRFKEMASSSRDTTFPKTTTLCDVLDDDDDDGQRNGGGKGRRRGNHVEDER